MLIKNRESVFAGIVIFACATNGHLAFAEESSVSIEDVGGKVRTEYARQAHNDEDKATVILEPELELNFGNESSLFIKPRLNFSPTADFEAIYDDQTERSDLSRIERFNDYFTAELRDFYIETPLGAGHLTLGKQQVFWGTADGLRVLDVINPVDLSNFIMAEPVDSRIPLWMVNYQRSFDLTDIQLLWIPDNTYNDYTAETDWYYLTSPKIVPGPPPSGVPVQLNPVDRKEGDLLDESDYGIRFTSVVGGWDLTFNYLYHYDDDLIVKSQLENTAQGPLIQVNPTYERSHLLGGSFAVASGAFVYRSEYGYNSDKYILSKNPESKTGVENLQDFSYVFGVDWSGITNHFISAQFFQSILRGNTHGLVRDRVDSTFTLNVSRNMRNETWRVEGLYLYSLNDKDSALRTRIKYSYDDKTAFYLQYENYTGMIDGVFGQFRDKDRVLFYFDRYF